MDYIAIYYYHYDTSTIFYIDDDSDELKSLDRLKLHLAENKYHSFRMFENYESTHIFNKI